MAAAFCGASSSCPTPRLDFDPSIAAVGRSSIPTMMWIRAETFGDGEHVVNLHISPGIYASQARYEDNARGAASRDLEPG